MSFSFRAITPKELNIRAMGATIERSLLLTGLDIQKDYNRSTATWDTKVVFPIVLERARNATSVLVTTDSLIFRFVDKGTKPHIIRPKRKGMLAFSSGYSRKSVPNTIQSRAGGARGNKVFATEVHHPGSKAAKITETIKKRQTPKFTRRMMATMNLVAKVSGHAI